MENDELISRAELLAGIEELKQSPWYNYGKYEGSFDDLTVLSMIDMIKYSERKEAIDVITEQCIKKEPAVEAAPMEHGRWILYPESLEYDGAYCKDNIVCSVCHYVWDIRDNCTDKFDCCPHCGARMDGENNGR